MNIIPIKHEREVKGWHVTFIDDSPESAAMTIAQRYGVEVQTVYTCGRRVFVPVNVTDEQHMAVMDNGC
jgi:hypothetical protein